MGNPVEKSMDKKKLSAILTKLKYMCKGLALAIDEDPIGEISSAKFITEDLQDEIEDGSGPSSGYQSGPSSEDGKAFPTAMTREEEYITSTSASYFFYCFIGLSNRFHSSINHPLDISMLKI
jgi:hypothetical protein